MVYGCLGVTSGTSVCINVSAIQKTNKTKAFKVLQFTLLIIQFTRLHQIYRIFNYILISFLRNVND